MEKRSYANFARKMAGKSFRRMQQISATNKVNQVVWVARVVQKNTKYKDSECYSFVCRVFLHDLNNVPKRPSVTRICRKQTKYFFEVQIVFMFLIHRKLKSVHSTESFFWPCLNCYGTGFSFVAE